MEGHIHSTSVSPSPHHLTIKGNPNMLSSRIQANLKPSPLFDFMGRALASPYCEPDNPNGIISLGIAENTLMANELSEFLSKNMKITPELFGYGGACPGLPSIVTGLLKLYNSEPFFPSLPVKKEHLYVTAGCAALLDQLFWVLCNEGEGVLLGKPTYGGFTADMTARAKLMPVPVSLKGIDPFSVEAVGQYEKELLRSEENGVKVRMLILNTPHNPLGQCYPRETMIAFMHLCQKYQIHLLSDEIYALSTFSTNDIPNPTPFTSLLSIDKTGIIDPELCHVIHGMSKDFCANGIRFAMLISQSNALLHKAIRTIALFSWPSSLAGLSFSTILNHSTFFSTFRARNRKLLSDRYSLCTSILKAYSIPYIPSNAGFFLWADLSHYLNSQPGDTALQRERSLNELLFNGGVHLATSEAFSGEDFGWFRITFSVDERLLKLGLDRLVKVLGAKRNNDSKLERGSGIDKPSLIKRMIGDFAWSNMTFSETARRADSGERMNSGERIQSGGCVDCWGVI